MSKQTGVKVSFRRNSFNNFAMKSLMSGSREEKEIIDEVSRSCLDVNFLKHWKLKDVHQIHNTDLEQKYYEKKKELKAKSRKERDLKDQFVFSIERPSSMKGISMDGVFCRSERLSFGNPMTGINLIRHADLALKKAIWMKFSPVSLVMYKVMMGKSKPIDTESRERTPLDGSPDFDSHYSRVRPTIHETLQSALLKGSVYIYEYDNSALPVDRPRHCLPMAWLNYEKVGEIDVNPAKSLVQSELKASTTVETKKELPTKGRVLPDASAKTKIPFIDDDEFVDVKKLNEVCEEKLKLTDESTSLVGSSLIKNDGINLDKDLLLMQLKYLMLRVKSVQEVDLIQQVMDITKTVIDIDGAGPTVKRPKLDDEIKGEHGIASASSHLKNESGKEKSSVVNSLDIFKRKKSISESSRERRSVSLSNDKNERSENREAHLKRELRDYHVDQNRIYHDRKPYRSQTYPKYGNQPGSHNRQFENSGSNFWKHGNRQIDVRRDESSYKGVRAGRERSPERPTREVGFGPPFRNNNPNAQWNSQNSKVNNNYSFNNKQQNSHFQRSVGYGNQNISEGRGFQFDEQPEQKHGREATIEYEEPVLWSAKNEHSTERFSQIESKKRDYQQDSDYRFNDNREGRHFGWYSEGHQKKTSNPGMLRFDSQEENHFRWNGDSAVESGEEFHHADNYSYNENRGVSDLSEDRGMAESNMFWDGQESRSAGARQKREHNFYENSCFRSTTEGGSESGTKFLNANSPRLVFDYQHDFQMQHQDGDYGENW